MIYMFIAEGFEEIEALCPLDLMRRAGLEVKTVGIGGTSITGAHGITVKTDIADTDFSYGAPQMIFLPGGMPGTLNLAASSVVTDAIASANKDGIYIAAICAAPIVLAKHGLLEGKTFTMYPGFDDYLGGLRPTGNPAESCDRVVTGKGPGAVFAFAEKLASALGTDLAPLYGGMFVEL